ncbi:DUSAM domain-containing protein [Myxococcus stipitatus]|uniref:DUSAM domain-containing protein n=1 Tax=Myxococcus stipitatus TaxID=83455 RepID=UPI003144DFCE
MPEELKWDEVRSLARRLSEGQPFALTDEVRALLRHTAPQVAMSSEEVERALQQESSAASLVDEVARRIRVGSRRLSRAINESANRQDAGDIRGAREPLEEVLAVEVVPHYRSIAQTHLDALDDPE